MKENQIMFNWLPNRNRIQADAKDVFDWLKLKKSPLAKEFLKKVTGAEKKIKKIYNLEGGEK